MIQENFNSVDPEDVPEIDPNFLSNEEDEDDESYDILPSNGPGLAGDDGEQVIDDEDEDVENEDE